MQSDHDFTRAPGQAPRSEFQQQTPSNQQGQANTRPRRASQRRTQNRSSTATPVTYLFCAICIIVFLIDYLMPQYNIHSIGIKDNDLILNSKEYYRLFTCTLLHSSIMHIVNNMIIFKSFGSICENNIKPFKFSILIICTALSASMSSLAFTQNNSVGASGICFGVVGAAMAINSVRHVNANLTRSCWSVIIINVILGLLNTNIDNAAHLGGLVGGWILGFGFGLYGDNLIDKILKILSFVAYGAVIYGLYGITHGLFPNPQINIPSFDVIPLF